MPEQTAIDRVLNYHESTKHHLNAYARSLGYLDWANQPDPFRRFEGAPLIPLDHPAMTDEPDYDTLYAGGLPARACTRETLSQLLYDSLALSAWKEAGPGARWSLRVNPSSGDLHPTEGYLICGPVEGLGDDAAVYHYAPFEHALERRLVLSEVEWWQLAEQLPTGAVLVALTSIYWRESWKYGERAFRYCNHDVGHALGTFGLAAVALGWQTRLISGIGDEQLAVFLGLHHQQGIEAEHPDCLLTLFPGAPDAPAPALELPGALLERLAGAEFAGTPRRLSDEHHPWPIIDEVVAAVRYDGQACTASAEQVSALMPNTSRRQSARRLIHRRRSAVAMDGATTIERAQFYHILARTTPDLSSFPYAMLPWRPRVALVLFVHRVNDLEPGVYTLLRHADQKAALKAAALPELEWEHPAGCPEDLEFYRLQAGDAQQAARVISCHQEIAADGAFSLGMLAEFEASVREGAWFYPRLFWETGLIGQVLYLEAEAAGVRATGIGCFFDDAMHQVLGIEDRSWQSLYHFTVGGAVDDARLRTLHPYFHKGLGE